MINAAHIDMVFIYPYEQYNFLSLALRQRLRTAY